jgi:uncharacterized protein (UPF0276 family)
MISIVTPVSSLFVDQHNAQIIDKHSDFLECRDHSPASDYSRHILFHTDLQPAHILTEEDFEYIEKIRRERPQLKLVSFHLASCYHDPDIENGLFVPGTKRYSREELLKNAKYNIDRIKKILGPDIAVAIENNNHYATPAYDYVTEPSFITTIVNDNSIYLLYDIAHAKVSAYNKGITYDAYKNGLPLHKTIQIHICKSAVNEKMAYDSHFLPDEEEWTEVRSLLNENNGIQYLTIEYYKEIDGLLSSLQQLKKAVSNE